MLLLPAILTHEQARDTVRLFRESAARVEGSELVLDGSALQRFDSSALAVIVECKRLAQARGQAFVVRGLPTKLLELGRLYGVAEVIGSGAALAAA